MVRVPIFMKYERPGSIGSALIQMMCAVNWSATSGRLSGQREDVAARDVDLVRERHRDGVARGGFLDLPVRGEQAGDGGSAPRRRDDDGVAAPKPAARNRAGIAAKVEIGPVHPLHRQPERRLRAILVDVAGFEIGEQRRAIMPGRAGARRGHVVSDARRDRDGDERTKAERLGEFLEGRDDCPEGRFVVIDEVDLVDRQHDMPDAEQRDDQRMAARLRQQALARVDQQDRQIRIRGAGRHVAGILFMARRVGDDERTFRRREIAIGDVDRDALFALGLETIDQQREVDFGAGRAVLLGIALERGELIVENQFLLVEQTSDQRRLAVVDRTAGQEAQGGQGIGQGQRVHG